MYHVASRCLTQSCQLTCKIEKASIFKKLHKNLSLYIIHKEVLIKVISIINDIIIK